MWRGLVGSVIDVSGEDIESPTEDDKGSVWYNAYKHDLAFAIRKFYAGTAATGTGTEYTDTDYFGPLNYAPNASVSDQIWYRPSNDTWYVSNAARQWFVTPFDELPATADIPTDSTTYTGGAVFLGSSTRPTTLRMASWQPTTMRRSSISSMTGEISASSGYRPTRLQLRRNPSGTSCTSLRTRTGSRLIQWGISMRWRPSAASICLRTPEFSCPEIGWVDLVGFVAATGRFALHIPVSLIRSLSTTAVPGTSTAATSSAHFATGNANAKVHFGHTADGNLLISSGTAGASRSVGLQLGGIMAELQWGMPIQGGETAPDALPVWLYKVSADGTRKNRGAYRSRKLRAVENGRLRPRRRDAR